MNCWHCGHPLIWQNDFDTSDYGYEFPGIVTVLSCFNCGAIVESACPENYNPETGEYGGFDGNS